MCILLPTAKNADIVVMERSVFSDRYGFATNVHQVGLMNDLEWKHYLEEYKWFMTEMLQLNVRNKILHLTKPRERKLFRLFVYE